MDSAWSAMMKALRSDRTALRVSDLVLVPRFFLHELAIQKRRPLGPNAR